MTTKVHVCKVYDKVMKTSELKIVFERDGKKFTGPLFFELNNLNKITRYIETIDLSDIKDNVKCDLKVFDAYIILSKLHGLKVFDDTMKTLKHWSCVNGFTDILHSVY